MPLEDQMSQTPIPPMPSSASHYRGTQAHVCLDDVLVTDQLRSRTPRRPDYASEIEVRNMLAAMMSTAPRDLPDALLAAALRLCNAGTAGLSLLEKTPSNESVFRWTNLAGVLKEYVGGCTPRDLSPCGVTLDHGSAQLFYYPGRYFPSLAGASPEIVEGLVVPLLSGEPVGTLWIVSHDTDRQFDAEDARIMTSIAILAGSALRMIRALESERLARQAAEEQVAARRTVEETLRASEEFNRKILASTSDCMKVLDLDFRLKFMSPTAMQLMEVEDFSRCENADWISFWNQADRPSVLAALDRAASGGTGSFHAFCPTMKGTPKWWDVDITPIKDSEGRVIKLLASSRDVTERRKAEEALRASHDSLEKKVGERTARLETEIAERLQAEANLRELSGRLLQTQDDERRRIARELHDSAGQYLAGIQMNLNATKQDQSIASSPSAPRISEALEMAQRCTSEIRTMSYLLHPPLLDEVGLSSALSWYVEGFAERSGIETELQISTELGRLPMETETALFRVVQQALANIHRHSGSLVARIRVECGPENIIAEICDEGRGMPPGKLAIFQNRTQLIGVGLAGMRERIEGLAGQLEIKSGSSGTTVRVTLPFTNSSAQRANA